MGDLMTRATGDVRIKFHVISWFQFSFRSIVGIIVPVTFMFNKSTINYNPNYICNCFHYSSKKI